MSALGHDRDGAFASDTLDTQGEAEWERLRQQIDLANGFWLAFVFCDSPRTADVLKDRSERMLHARARTLREVRPTVPADMRGVLPMLLGWDSAKAGCSWLSIVHTDIPGSPGRWAVAWDDLLLRMNERRDALRRHLSGGLVFAAASGMKPRIREVAPDLWSIRSLVVEVLADSRPKPSRSGDKPASQAARAPTHSMRDAGTGAWKVDETGRPIPDPDFALGEAERRAESGKEGKGTSVMALLRAAEGYLAAGKTGQAVRVARDAVHRTQGATGLTRASALARLAEAEEADGDLAAAAEHVEQAIRIRSSTFDKELSSLYDRAGKLAMSRADLAYAINAYHDMLLVTRKLLETRGETFETLRDVLVSLNKLSDVELEAGHVPEAMASARESLDLSRRLRKLHGDTPEILRDLSIALNRLGNAYLRAGDLAHASAAYEESLAFRRQLRVLCKDDPEALRDLSLSLNRLGSVRRQEGDLDAAAAVYSESLALRRRLRELRGDTAAVLRDLIVVLCRLGDVRRDAHDLAAAAVAYEESLALARRILALRGDTPETLHDLSLSLGRLGDVRSDAGDLAAAASAYDESVALIRRVCDVQGDTAQTLDDLVEALARSGRVRRALGQHAAAAIALSDGATAARKRVQLEDNSQARATLGGICRDLADTYRQLGNEAAAREAEEEVVLLTKSDPNRSTETTKVLRRVAK